MFGPRLSRARLAAFVVVSALAVPGGVISAAGDTAHQPCERERHSCGTLIIAGPVGPSTLPEGVARTSLRAHARYGIALLALLVTAANAALHVLVLRPLQRIRARLVRMEHGDCRSSIDPPSHDEVGQFVHSFQVLGLEIDALVGQSLQGERLAVLALLSQRLRAQLEPNLEQVAEIAARLNGGREADSRAAGQALARSTASMFAAVRGLDRAFSGDARAEARASTLGREHA